MKLHRQPGWRLGKVISTNSPSFQQMDLGLNCFRLEQRAINQKLEHAGDFSLTVEFVSKKDNLRWWCTVVYRPNERSCKHAFLGGTKRQWRCFHYTVGDFNLEDIRNANSLMFDLGLQESPMVGRRFSWTNGQTNPIWVKLDHFLIKIMSGLPTSLKWYRRVSLDLGLIMCHFTLKLANTLLPLRPFRYKLVWSTKDGFHNYLH